jgi:hypothetical protein
VTIFGTTAFADRLFSKIYGVISELARGGRRLIQSIIQSVIDNSIVILDSDGFLDRSARPEAQKVHESHREIMPSQGMTFF